MRKMNGVVSAVVKSLDDPTGQARIQLGFPWLSDTQRSSWAPVAAAMAGGGRGAFLMPEVGDEVLVSFEHGDFDHPFIVGFLWNGVDQPPGQDHRDRKLVSKNGHQIRFLDSTPSGGSNGAMSNGKINITSTGVLSLNAPTILANGRLIVSNANPI
jgi:uncharacterized protein involved in type VI secretion and phage assembly